MAIGAYNSDKAEMYTESGGWTEVQNVPHKIVYVQNSVAVVDNVLYIVGGHDYSTWRKGNEMKLMLLNKYNLNSSTEIYKFNPDSLTWTEVGQTPYAMEETAVVAITKSEANTLCNNSTITNNNPSITTPTTSPTTASCSGSGCGKITFYLLALTT